MDLRSYGGTVKHSNLAQVEPLIIMKADIGTFQELQADGKIAESFTRKLSAATFVAWWVYFGFSYAAYESHFNKYCDLVKQKVITESSFNLVVSESKMVDWNIFLLLAVATVAPKVIQKFAELRTSTQTDKQT